jgi:hypothetical protein
MKMAWLFSAEYLVVCGTIDCVAYKQMLIDGGACVSTFLAVLLQKLVFDAFVENRVSIFQRVTAVKNRTTHSRVKYKILIGETDY